MNKTIVFVAYSLLFTVVKSAYSQNTGVLKADLAKDIINRNIYGHFAEHLGRCIYDGFYVGDNNTRIANTNGMRQDIVEALKKLKVPVLRWPGGCFADTYHWKDGIGPKASRPKIVNTWWGGVTEDNSFGTHEFMELCGQIGAEPYLSANVGSGTVQEVSQWVEYLNADGQSPMASLRAQNGHEKSWKVKYWGVGNEAWGCGGNMKAEHYADVYRQYSTFMTGNVFKIASGANSGDYNWTEVLMRDIPHNQLEGVALHHYSVIDWNKKSSADNFTDEEYFLTMKQAWRMEELIQKHTAIMDKYDPKKKVALVVDEWGGWYDVEPGTNPGFLFQQNTMRDAMIAGLTLNMFNNHCDRVKMANVAQAVNVLQAVVLTQGEKMILTPTYHVMEMYNVHQDATMIPLTLKSGDFVMGNDKLTALSASASKDKDGVIHITVTNIDNKQVQDLSIDLQGIKASSVAGRILASGRIQDHNTFDQPTKVQPTVYSGASIKGNTLSVKMPAASVVVLTLK